MVPKYLLVLLLFSVMVLASDSVTIDNFNHSGTITVTTDSGTLFNVQAIDPSSVQGTEGLLFSGGMVYFEVNASAANVEVRFSNVAVNGATYYKYTSVFPGSEPALYDFSAQLTPNENGWVLHLTEGGFGDATGNDNLIVDPGGPAVARSAVLVPLSQKSMMVLAVLMLVAAEIFIRRREDLRCVS